MLLEALPKRERVLKEEAGAGEGSASALRSLWTNCVCPPLMMFSFSPSLDRGLIKRRGQLTNGRGFNN